MPDRIGRAVLVVSGMGFPLSQLAIRRFGRRGAILVEAVSVGLMARDAALLAMGASHRLRRGPARLLWLETAAAAAAALTGLGLMLDEEARQAAVAARPAPLEALRRAALGTLFGLHTLRFRIYLSPDHGLRQPK